MAATESGWTRSRAAVAGDRFLRYAAVIFVIALVVHGADHARRGFDVLSQQVSIAGNAQLLFAAVAVVLVFLGHRWAPMAAIVVGFASALGFSAAHLLPEWSVFSDSFVGAPPAAAVTAFSWVTAFLEIGADLLFGTAGIVALRRRAALVSD